jgi:hypothetical protein
MRVGINDMPMLSGKDADVWKKPPVRPGPGRARGPVARPSHAPASLQRGARGWALRALLAGVTIGLGGCFQPTGPVVGDWYGYPPLPAPQAQLSVELVLDGLPTARQGVFRMHTQTMWMSAAQQNQSDYLTGGWTAQPVTIDGQTYRRIDLSGLDTGMHHETLISHFIELPNGVLVPATADGKPDLSPGGLAFRLAPRARGSFGYGRV